MIHEIEVSNLMFNKTSDEQINFKKYDINVELEEESSNDQRTILKYSFDLTSNPKNSVINISGNTTLNGEQSEIEELLKQDDEKTFFGDDTPEDTAKRYHDLGVGLVVVKNGVDEILASDTNNNQLRFTPKQVEHPVDTTAAGDSFNAGFLASLVAGDDIETAVRAGAALSAKVINHRGALVEI